MIESLLAAAALLAGLLLGWFLAQRNTAPLTARLHEAERQLADARARAEEKDLAMAQQRRTADELRQELDRSFHVLAAAALKQSSDHLLTMASERFAPFNKQLADLKAATDALESRRAEAYGSLSRQLLELKSSASELKSQSERLSSALRGSTQARGRWGESTLLRLVELAGMQEHCDFDTQTTTTTGQRPDLVVRLPGKGAIPVDAKVPLAAYLDAETAADDDARRARFAQHAADLKNHVRELARRDYAKDLGGQVDFTVLFVPGEPFLAAGFMADPDLFDWALAQRVLIASPVTLLALLRTVRLNWDKLTVEKNAQEIRDVALKLFESVRVFAAHFERTGAGLGKAVEAYNAAVGSFERNVMPKGRKLSELRVGESEALPELGEMDQSLRTLAPLEQESE